MPDLYSARKWYSPHSAPPSARKELVFLSGAFDRAIFINVNLNNYIIKTIDPSRGMADARRSVAYEAAYLRGIFSWLFMGKC